MKIFKFIFSVFNFIFISIFFTGKPEISLIDSKVLMPVDDVPVVGRGCSSACDFYFEIDHKPATKVHQWIKQLENNIPASIFVSIRNGYLQQNCEVRYCLFQNKKYFESAKF